MGLKEGDLIRAADFVSIKARVKAECKRRKYNGSVASYAGASYDYTVAPKDGDPPLAEHFNKIIVPLNAIVDTGRTQTSNGYLVRAINDIESKLTTLEAIDATAASSGCKSSCTGLCQGTCTTGCTGCTGGCSGSCGTGCANGCSSGCTGGCKNGCKGSCVNGCGEYCEGACDNTCKTTCDTACTGGCKGVCKGTCVSSAGLQ